MELVQPPLNVELFYGPAAASMAGLYWDALDKPRRRAILWDAPMDKRSGYLRMAWFNADCVALGWEDGDLAAAAWVTETGPGARCGTVHFSFTKKAAWPFLTGALFHKALKKDGRFKSLLGMVPAPFRHAARFAGKLGYREAARLSGACPLADYGRVVDGILLHRELVNG